MIWPTSFSKSIPVSIWAELLILKPEPASSTPSNWTPSLYVSDCSNFTLSVGGESITSSCVSELYETTEPLSLIKVFPTPNVPLTSLRIRCVLTAVSGAVEYLNPLSTTLISIILPMSVVFVMRFAFEPFSVLMLVVGNEV